ncbi:arginase family protein [Grosmannia clavigera kw1407]|uniref:Arginase family protein n=1 Tax=Grosmannia clavigera (strain kw1407 / UAMH 11150) TaxID=655863 RepID=F0XA37_GROCL|nr:arginase family protein [Grosmannia clavigera kw1407]EFX05834.1 arginase family protein [Grosmannia clavigera kw1407]
MQDRASFVSKSIFRHQPEMLAALADPGPHLYDEVEGTPFQGTVSFAHLETPDCFSAAEDGIFDIAIVGAPFDLGVTYRPGARFGPAGARMGSRRIAPSVGYRYVVCRASGPPLRTPIAVRRGYQVLTASMDNGVNPFRDWAKVVDCGDVSNSPFDKLLAIHELQKGWEAVASRKVRNPDNGTVPRIIGIGGDHTISLPAIRALSRTWGRVAVLHFDSHLDSWDPKQLGGGKTKYAEINHGTMFHILHEEGLLSKDANMHLGARTMLFDKSYDLENDARCGFSYIRARELDVMGVDKIVAKVVETVGDSFVYLSLDIDVLDPAFAPATGTIEPGGWTAREMLQILDGLSQAGVKIVGADVVEFTPVYDNSAETTGLMVAQLVYEILQWMVRVPVSPQ